MQMTEAKVIDKVITICDECKLEDIYCEKCKDKILHGAMICIFPDHYHEGCYCKK